MMAKGDGLKSEPRIIKDKKTGHDVWRMTSEDNSNCVATYFHLRAFSGDERYIIFTSERSIDEYWGPMGQKLYFHKKTVSGWTPTSIASISIHGDDLKEYFSSRTRKLGHSCIDPNGKIIVTDIQEPYSNELIAIDLDTGEQPNWNKQAFSNPISHPIV